MACYYLGSDPISTSMESTPPYEIYRVLHFGPVPQMADTIRQIKQVDQILLDYFAEGYTYPPNTFKGDVNDINLPDKFVDLIIIIHVLEHITTTQKALSELYRVLKPSGHLLVEVPVRGDLPTADCTHSTSKEERKAKCGQFDHVWRFSKDDFEETLKNANFECQLDQSDPWRKRMDIPVWLYQYICTKQPLSAENKRLLPQ